MHVGRVCGSGLAQCLQASSECLLIYSFIPQVFIELYITVPSAVLGVGITVVTKIAKVCSDGACYSRARVCARACVC